MARINFLKQLANLSDINDIEGKLITLLAELDTIQINYVCGSITSDGPEMISRNIATLNTYTDYVAKQYSCSTFNFLDIFSPEI